MRGSMAANSSIMIDYDGKLNKVFINKVFSGSINLTGKSNPRIPSRRPSRNCLAVLKMPAHYATIPSITQPAKLCALVIC